MTRASIWTATVPLGLAIGGHSEKATAAVREANPPCQKQVAPDLH